MKITEPLKNDGIQVDTEARAFKRFTMKVKIKRLDKDLPLPVYETAGSVGFDLVARVDCRIEAGKIELIPANVIIGVPEGYMLIVASRSGTPRKKGLTPPHGLGIIDHDYCGPEDEIKIQVYNFSDRVVTVARGEKIAQGIFVRADSFAWEETEEISPKSRGGFGSTDRRPRDLHEDKSENISEVSFASPKAFD